MTEEQKAEIRVMFRRGYIVKQIAEELELDQGDVRQFLANGANGMKSVKAAPKKVKQKVTKLPFEVPDYAPICNATATETYKPTELNYRGKK